MGLVGCWFDNARHDYEVPNKVWLVFGIGGFIVSGFRWGWSPLFLGIHLLIAAIVSGGVFFVWYLVGVTWSRSGVIGGADVKAIMALSVTLGNWSLFALLFSVVVLEIYAVGKGVYLRLPVSTWLKMNAPFLPFLTVGVIGGFMVALATFV